jgi:flagellar basal-body rod modification protein FlgD
MALSSSSITAAGAQPGNGLGQEEFMKLMLAQLQYQDPLKPMDNQQFVAQMAQFSALAQAQQSNESLQALLSVQARAQTIGLLNRNVDFLNEGATVSGRVASIAFDSEVPQMDITLSASGGGTVRGVTLDRIVVVKN